MILFSGDFILFSGDFIHFLVILAVPGCLIANRHTISETELSKILQPT